MKKILLGLSLLFVLGCSPDREVVEVIKGKDGKDGVYELSGLTVDEIKALIAEALSDLDTENLTITLLSNTLLQIGDICLELVVIDANGPGNNQGNPAVKDVYLQTTSCPTL